MPYPNGDPTLDEQIDEDARRRFYTDDILKEARELSDENDQLADTLIKIAKGRDDNGCPISGEAAQSFARVALKAAGRTWGDYQPDKGKQNG